MSVVAWPADLVPNEIRWGIRTNTLGLVSPFTGSGQFHELQGARWICSTTFRALNEDQQRELSGFLDHLRGPVGVAAMPAWLHYVAAGTAGGTITATAAAHAKSVTLAGVTGASPAFKRGDLIGIGGRLYRVTLDADQTAGAATVSIAPPLREAAAGAAVTLSNLTCPMHMLSDEEAIGRFRPRPFGDLSIDWVEALTVSA